MTDQAGWRNRRTCLETLESRRLFAAGGTMAAAAVEPISLTPLDVPNFTNVDIATRAGNESEAGVAVDPNNPNRIFTAANIEDLDAGLVVGLSTDGGATWTNRVIGDGKDTLPGACCDSTAAFDRFGNLYLAYLNADSDDIELVRSTDGGESFTPIQTFEKNLDQPTLAVGHDSIWLTFARGSKVGVTGAAITGLGQIGDFLPVTTLKGTTSATFGDIAVGGDGQVVVTYQFAGGPRAGIGVSVDPDGLGPATFGTKVIATTTSVSQFESIPAQPQRGVDAEAGLAIDASTGAFRGRVYLIYCDAAARPRDDIDLFVRYSDDNGLTWSAPARVNDDAGGGSQVLPRIAIDNTTGRFAMSWLDTRNDPGNLDTAPKNTPTDQLDYPNDEVETFMAIGEPTATGVRLSANVKISAGQTSAFDSDNGIELGDYTGLVVGTDGVAHPVWSDNSNSAGGNPDGAGHELDMYSAAVPLASMPAADRVIAGGLATAGSSAPVVTLYTPKGPLSSRKTKPLLFTVQISDADGIVPASLGEAISVTGPNGFSETATLVKTKTKGTVTLATYSIAAASGSWSSADRGSHQIAVKAATIADLASNTADAGEIGTFFLDV